MIDYRIPSETILHETDLVINAGGTILSEAAMYRKPAIQLGDMGLGFPGYEIDLPRSKKHRFIYGNHDNPEVCRNHIDTPSGETSHSTATSSSDASSAMNSRRKGEMSWLVKSGIVPILHLVIAATMVF